jgi:hypothetical protein
VAAFVVSGAARAHPGCHTRACEARVQHKQERAEWRRYRAHPMPWCTWGPESGVSRPEWSLARYRQPAIGQGPAAGGGKFQIIDSTWRHLGGLRWAAHAYQARPLIQERLARRLMRRAGIRGTWANC